MAEVRYICPGSCNKIISEEDFKNGITMCDSENCERNGQPLLMKLFCPNCEVYYGEEETHECD